MFKIQSLFFNEYIYFFNNGVGSGHSDKDHSLADPYPYEDIEALQEVDADANAIDLESNSYPQDDMLASDLEKSMLVNQVSVFLKSNRANSITAIETDTAGALAVLENCVMFIQSRELANRYLAINPQTPVRIKGITIVFDQSGRIETMICITNLTEVSYTDHKTAQTKVLNKRGEIVIIDNLNDDNLDSARPEKSGIKTKMFRHNGEFISFAKLRKKARSKGVKLMPSNVKYSHSLYLFLVTCYELISLDEFVEFSEVEEN